MNTKTNTTATEGAPHIGIFVWGEAEGDLPFVKSLTPITFQEKIVIGRGVTLDAQDRPLDGMYGAHPDDQPVRLLMEGFYSKPNSVAGALLNFERRTLINAGRSLYKFVEKTPELLRVEDEIRTWIKGSVVKAAVNRDVETFLDRMKLCAKATSLLSGEAIPFLLGISIGSVFIYYRLGVPDPWRMTILGVTRKLLGNFDISDPWPFITFTSAARVMWLSAELGSPDKEGNRIQTQVFSDYVPSGMKPVLTGEATPT